MKNAFAFPFHCSVAFILLVTAPASAFAVEMRTTPVIEVTTQAGPVIARPKITGEYIVEADLKTVKGETQKLSPILEGHFSVVVFSKPENIWFESALGYFRKIAPYLAKLDYQIIVITPEAYDYIRDIAQTVETKGRGRILIDSGKKAFTAMGLMDPPMKDATTKDAPSINAIYLVSPDRQIMFQFSSVSNKIPFSGEVLVLAARVYRDAFRSQARE